jgi:hypothetical protein
MSRDERLAALSVDDAEIMALTSYEEPVLIGGSNEGELLLKGWTRELCTPCTNDNALEVLSHVIGEKTVVATLHTCAFLRGLGSSSVFQPWGAIKVDPPARSVMSLQLEASEIFAKINRVIQGRTSPDGLWAIVVDDLTRLLMAIRTTVSGLGVDEEREVTPQGALLPVQFSWREFLLKHRWFIQTGLVSLTMGGALLLRERIAQPQMEFIPGVATARNFAATMERAPATLDRVAETADELRKVGLNVNQIIASVKQWTNLTETSPVSQELLCLFLDLIRECLQTHPLGLTTLAIRFCTTFNILSYQGKVVEYLTQIWAYYTPSPVTKLDTTGVEERLAVPNGPGEILCALVALIGLGVCKGAFNDKSTVKVVESLRMVNLCVPAGRNLASLMGGIATILPPGVAAWFEELCPEQLWLQALKEEDVEEWMMETEKFCVDSNKLLLVHDAELQYQLACLKKRGEKISSKLSCLARCAPGMYNRILRRLELVDDFVRHLAVVSGVIDSKRPVPFCVYLYGDAGIGKSVATEAIVEALVPPEIPKRLRVYSRVPGSDYFDGYLCQFAVVMDDYAQSADGEDALELIRMVNSTNYMPPMASLDNASIGVKATPFTSRLLVLSSNTGYPTSQKVTKQGAVWRRRHYLLECKVRPEYATGGQLDMAKVPMEIAANLGHIQWLKRNSMDHRAEPLEMTTLEMLLDLRKAYRVHEERMNFLLQGGLFSGLLEQVKALERPALPQMEATVYNRKHCITSRVNSLEAVAAMAQEVRDLTDEPTEIDLDFETACSQVENTTSQDLSNSKIMSEEDWHHLFREPLVRKSFKKLSDGTQSIAEGYQCLRSGVRKFLEEHPWISTCVAGAGVAAAVFGAVAFAWSHFASDVVVPNMANPSPGDLKHEATSVRFKKRQFTAARQAAANGESMFSFAGSPNDPEGNKWVELLSQNMVYMRVHNPSDDSAFGMGGFVLRSRSVILPYHFFCPCGDLVEDGRQMSVLWKGKETRFLFERRKLQRFPETDENGRLRDLAFYELPVTVAPFKDRSQQVVDDNYLEHMHRKPGFLISMRSGKLNITMLPDIKVSQITTSYTIGSARFATPVTLEYTAPTQVGDCGALILVSDPSMQARIVGIHVASYKNFGIGDFLTSVELAHMDAICPAQGERGPVVPNMCLEGKKSKFVPRGDFTILGGCSRAAAVRMADSTHIVPSLLYDQVRAHEDEPAVLRPDDPRIGEAYRGQSIILKAIEKYGNPTGPFDGLIMDQVVDFYTDMFVSPDTCYPRRVLTLEESINGIRGMKYMDGLCMKSSAGYGFRKPGCPGKGHLFSQREDGTYELVSPLLHQLLAERREQAKLGNRVQSVWTDSLKDELRPIAKIEQAKTRAFCIPQVDYTLLVRQYFLSFCGHFYSLHKSSFSAVGCDPESSDWDIFARQLLSVSDNMFDLDFENFDGRTSAEVTMAVLDLVQRFYDDGEEAYRVRKVLVEEMIHTVAICGDTFYVKHGGMPSGSPLTVVFNTLVNCFYMYYAYLHLVPKPLADAAIFRKSVGFKIYGDDNVGAVVRSLMPFYNPTRIAALLLEHGIVITPASKNSKDFAESMTLQEVTFLKRHFAIVPDISPIMYVPQMADRTIFRLTNWIHDNGDPMEMTLVNCETSLRFAMFKGRPFFDALRNDICVALKRLSPQAIHLPHYTQLVRNFSEMHCGVSLPPSNEEILLAQNQLGERTAIPQMQHMRDLGSSAMASEPAKVDQKGVTLTTQEGMVVQDKLQKVRTRPLADSMLEAPWSIKTIAERENFLNQVSWDSTASYGSPLMNFTLPDASFPDSPFTRLFRQFTYYKGDWVITFQLNGTRFHQGMLLASWTPLTRTTTTSMKFSKVHGTAMQHVMLNASTSTTAQLRIPFIHTQPYLPTTTSDETLTLGRVMLQVLNGLEYSTGASTALWVSASYHVENLEVYLPTVKNITGPVAERVAKPNAEMVPLAPTQEQEEEQVPALGPEMHAPRKKLHVNGEENYTSFRDIIKRRMPLFDAPLQVSGTTTAFRNLPAFCVFDASILFNRQFPCSFVNDTLGMYGMVRGSMKFTFEFAETGKSFSTGDAAGIPASDKRYFAMFLPMMSNNLPEDVTTWTSPEAEFQPWWSPASMGLVPGGTVQTGLTTIQLEQFTWRVLNLLPKSGWALNDPTVSLSMQFKAGSRGPAALAYSDTPYLNLEIPYSSVYDAYLNYAFPTPLKTSGGGRFSPGTIICGVIGARTAANGVGQPVANVCVYGSIGDATRAGVFHAVPKVGANAIVTPLLAYSMGFDEREGVPQGNQVSVWHNKIHQQFGDVGTASLPLNITGDKFDVKQKASATLPIAAMDKPSWTLNGDPVLRQAMPYLSHAQNIEPCDVMALYPSTNVECEPSLFGTDADEMRIDFLAQKSTYLTTFKWTTSSAVDGILWSTGVGVVNPVSDSVTDQLVPGTTVDWPLVDVVSVPFSKWNGSLRYRFQFVCSGFHTGRLWIALNYTTKFPFLEAAPADIVSATNQYGVMVDVGPNMQDITFDVPYKAPTEWALPGNANPANYGIANISVWVINQLVAPEGVPTSVDVNVFKAAGPDFQLSTLGGVNSGLSYVYPDDPKY